MLGGPLFQLLRRARLSGNALELLQRRMIVISCVAWVPLLLLSLAAGHALGGTLEIPFLYDVEAHARFLIALPLLIAAELVVHMRMRPVVVQFLERRIIADEEMPKFRAAIESTLRLRNSLVGEVSLAVVVYSVGIWVWRSRSAIATASWYAIPGANGMEPTWAGYWYVLVSVPIFQFIVLRWYLRFCLWFWFLWKVSRLNLRLIPIHPDRTAGLSFLANSTNAFVPILFAQGASLAGMVANQIFYAGQTLPDFKAEIAAFVGFFVVAILTPLTVFAPQLARIRRQGLREFGKLASRYVDEFEAKWMQRPGDRGGAVGERRHPVARRPGQQLCPHPGNALRAVRNEGRHAACGGCGCCRCCR